MSKLWTLLLSFAFLTQCKSENSKKHLASNEEGEVCKVEGDAADFTVTCDKEIETIKLSFVNSTNKVDFNGNVIERVSKNSVKGSVPDLEPPEFRLVHSDGTVSLITLDTVNSEGEEVVIVEGDEKEGTDAAEDEGELGDGKPSNEDEHDGQQGDDPKAGVDDETASNRSFHQKMSFRL
ncbi:MAG: hypothetical protein HRU09_17775 [Oligoflexales bacterium]|nr:hypothetical protein [Oligoflexales bacterium]